MKLDKGQSIQCRIVARKMWNATHVDVQAGDLYEFHADGEWCDLTIRTTARGYATADAPWYSRWFLARFEDRRRLPAENWFVLVGAVGRHEESAFVIGAGQQSWPGTGLGRADVLCERCSECLRQQLRLHQAHNQTGRLAARIHMSRHGTCALATLA